MMEEVGVDDHQEVTTKMAGASISDELREAAQTNVTQGTIGRNIVKYNTTYLFTK